MKNLLVVYTVLLAGCASIVKVDPIVTPKVGKPPQQGICYTLPKRLMVVKIPVTLTVRKPGTAYLDSKGRPGFTEEQFDMDLQAAGFNPAKAAKDFEYEYEYGTPFSVDPMTVPDPEAKFVVRLSSSIIDDLGIDLELGPNGNMLGGSGSGYNRSVDYFITTLETTATIASKFAVAGGTPAALPYQQTIHDIGVLQKQIKETVADGALDGSTIETRIKIYKEQIDALVATLLGTEDSSEPWTADVQVDPPAKGASPDGDTVLLSEIGSTGLVFHQKCLNSFANPLKAPRSTKSVLFKNTSSKGNVYLSLSCPSDQLVDHVGGTMIPKLDRSALGKGSFFYRIPREAKLRVFLKSWAKDPDTDKENITTKTVFATSMLIPQYGVIAQLPHSYWGVKTTVDLKLDPDTGALTKFALSKTGYEAADTVGRLGKTANEVTDRYLEANDEVKKLEREKSLLQLRQDVRQLKAQEKAASHN